MMDMEIDRGTRGLQERKRQRVDADGRSKQSVSYAVHNTLPHNQNKKKEKYWGAQDYPTHRHFGTVGEGKLKQPARRAVSSTGY